MTSKLYLENLSKQTLGEISLPDLPISVGKSDIMAAKLLLWLDEQMPNAIQIELDEVLNSAKWWSTYWASVDHANIKRIL